MTEKELHKLFADKLKSNSFPFNEKAWESMEQMLDPQEPLSEMEYSKLFKDKLSTASFAYNPANWDEMELKLNEAQGAMSQEEMKNLFQTKLQSQNFKFNPANWERMEAILNSKAKKTLFYFWRSAAAIFIFAASVLAFNYTQQAPLTISPTQQSISLSPKQNTPAVVSPKTELPANLSPASSNKAEDIASTNLLPNSTPAKTPVASPTMAILPPSNNNTSESLASLAAAAFPTNSVSPFTGDALQEETLLANNAGINSRDWRDLSIDPVRMSLAEQATNNAFTVAAPPSKEVYVPMNYSKISLQGGPSINPAYNGSTGTGFFAGLEYEYGFNERISISAGLIYNYGGDMGIESISDSTFFGLARTDVETHSHYKNMSALRMPISFNVKFNPKHSFSVGAYADVVIAVSMDQQKTTTIFKQDPKVEKMSGQAPDNSFTNYSGGLHLAYTYQYSKHLSIGLSQQYGLVDLSNDHQQNFSKHHQTSQTNLVLKYSIWEQ
tara:strand:- start:643 stop:2133 length:1491 start_codon:yes stop_codon:yes gene_type:complete